MVVTTFFTLKNRTFLKSFFSLGVYHIKGRFSSLIGAMVQFSDKESDVIRSSIGVISRSSMIGLENWRHFLRQLDAKLKTITSW